MDNQQGTYNNKDPQRLHVKNNIYKYILLWYSPNNYENNLNKAYTS